MALHRILAAAICSLLLLAGCGQKGPLTLPEQQNRQNINAVKELQNKPNLDVKDDKNK